MSEEQLGVMLREGHESQVTGSGRHWHTGPSRPLLGQTVALTLQETEVVRPHLSFHGMILAAELEETVGG